MVESFFRVSLSEVPSLMLHRILLWDGEMKCVNTYKVHFKLPPSSTHTHTAFPHCSPHKPPLKVKFSGVNEYINYSRYDNGSVHGRHGDGSHSNNGERHGEQQEAGRKGQSPSHAPSGHPNSGHSGSGHGSSGHKEQSNVGRHGEEGGQSKQDGAGRHK